MTDAETSAAIEALVYRLKNRGGEDDEVFALEYVTALRGRGWRPTPAKATAPPLHAPPLADGPSRDEALAAVRADMEARRAAAAREDGAA